MPFIKAALVAAFLLSNINQAQCPIYYQVDTHLDAYAQMRGEQWE